MNRMVFDTNLVIEVLEKPSVADQMRQRLRGKEMKIVVCGTVLRELGRVRRWSGMTVVARLRRIFGERRVVTDTSAEGLGSEAGRLRDRFAMAHRGDDRILAYCMKYSCYLLTFDREMLTVAHMLGVLAFHPRRAGEI